jgi:preprotein translocase subunit SecG
MSVVVSVVVVVVVMVVVVVVISGGGGGGKVSRNGLSLSFYSYAMFDRKKVSTLI